MGRRARDADPSSGARARTPAAPGLSEVACFRRSGDSALLLAIKAADYLAAAGRDGDEDVTAPLDEVRGTDVARTAFSRAYAIAALTEPNAA